MVSKKEWSEDWQEMIPVCVCSDPKPHFCPPCFGEEGFFDCDPIKFPPLTDSPDKVE